ncbi:hypothetical protein [Agromyces sp. Root81]|uniref:hypothetical protein n=1 Tax=Agromyces sp. Root81 TaxID=1736601 RepID=UPI000AC759FE|nr:hypothetical protein [Agromyces sp. Root81]
MSHPPTPADDLVGAVATTTLDLRWLQASESEVAAAMATVRRESRPKWVPTKRQVLVHVNDCLILWYLFIAFTTIAMRVHLYEVRRASAEDIGDLLLAIAILAVWLFGAYLLRRWASRPPSPRARMKEWRQTLTALANGFEPKPSPVATFSSLISVERTAVREYPRFVAPGVELGNLSYRSSGRSGEWHYLAVDLPAPLPHLILDATSSGRLSGDLPVGFEREQRMSLEGDFDRWFHVYSPHTYGKEALYVLTPDVMASLIDEAAGYNVEIIDDTLVFFIPRAADFSDAEPWEAAYAILTKVAPRIIAKSRRYLDERVPGQETPPLLAKIAAARKNPKARWTEPRAIIGPDGRRLEIRDRRTGLWSILGAVGWYALLTFLYVVPGLFAFAGFMSIVDGR